MAEGSLECSRPRACPSSCTATKNTSLPRRTSTPYKGKAREKSGADRRKTISLHLHDPTVASLLSPKIEPPAAHVKMSQRSRLLMLPNMCLLCQKLVILSAF